MRNRSEKGELKVRIALLIPGNVAGGAERVLTSLANQFIELNIDTWFIQFDTDSDFYNISDNVHKVALQIEAGGNKGFYKWMLFPRYFFSLKKVLRQVQPDVIISFLFITNVVGIICCKLLGIPIIISERNDPNQYIKKQKLVMNLLYPFVDGFVCQSDVVKDIINDKYKIKNATVIANPSNNSQVGVYQIDKKDLIIAVGRLVPQKNFSFLIDCFAEIAGEYPTYKLVIYGDGPLRNDLEDQIRYYGLNERIKLPGTIKDAIRINNNARIFVLSSKFEGYPNVLVEAMSNGLVCIASDVASGTVRQLIEHGVNGFIYPVDDKKNLVKLFRYTMESKNELSEISMNAKKIYNQLSIEKITNEWIVYIENCLDKSF